MKLFAVENRKTYQKSTSELKRGVLNVAITEINKYTELEVWYTEKKVGNKITGFTLHWSTGKREGKATEKQLSLLREIHDEVVGQTVDYILMKNMRNLDLAKENVKAIKEINQQVNKKLTSEKAKELISEAKTIYQQLQSILKADGKTRDTSFYYNWLEDTD